MADVELKRLGWYLSPEGIEECKEEGKDSVDDIIRAAMDMDLKDVGKKYLPEGTGKNKLDHIEGPVVLQIQKIRNVSAPKDNPDSQAAPPIFKLILTDGHSSCPAVEIEKINKLGLSTSPGTKVCLRGKVLLTTGFLQLNRSNCEVLGGRVQKLADNWQLKRTMAQQSRYNVGSEGAGPPPFVPFGQKRRVDDVPATGNRRENFKSLQDTRKEEEKKHDTEFEQQRRATIAAVTDLKQEQRGKVYGSGSIVKVSDRDVASIVEMGFSMDQATAALRQHNNLSQAVDALLSDKPSEPTPQPNQTLRNSDRGSDKLDRSETGDRSDRMDRQEKSERMDRRDQTDRMDRGNRSERTDRGDRSDRIDRRNQYERTDRGDRSERTDRGNRSERTDRGDRSERSDRRDHSDRMDRGERSDRIDRRDQTDKTDRPERTDRSERPERGRGRRGREEEEDDEYRKGPSAPATIFDFMVTKNPSVITEPKPGYERPQRAGRLERDSSKSSDTSDKRSTGSRDMGGGPPNLPPRLMRQQRQKEEEARARHHGPNDNPQQRPPPPPPPPPYGPLHNQQRQSRQGPTRSDHGEGGGSGGRGGGPNMRPTNYYQRTSYGPNKPVYDPHLRGPVQNRTLWNENGRGGGNNRRGNYNSRGNQEYYTQDQRAYENNDQGRRPNSRYNGNNPPPHHKFDNNNGGAGLPQQGYQRPPSMGRPDSSQYSNVVPRQYGGRNYPPQVQQQQYHQHQQIINSSSNSGVHGYRQNRHHHNPPALMAEEDGSASEQLTTTGAPPPPGQEQEVVDGSGETESSQQSPAAQDEAPSAVSELESEGGGETVEGGEVMVGYVDSSGGVTYVTEDDCNSGTAVTGAVLMEDESQQPAQQQQQATPVYVYAAQNGELSAMGGQPPHQAGAGAYVPLAAAPNLIPQMQQLTISGGAPAVSGGPHIPTYHHQPYPSPAAMGPPPAAQLAGPMEGQGQPVYGGVYSSPVDYSHNSAGGQPATLSVNGKNKESTYGDNGYPSESSGKSGRHWKPGDYCLAKYWEDAQFYRAIVQHTDPANGTAMVHFPDYGNVEQVVIKDIRPVPKNAWESNSIQTPVSMAMGVMASQPIGGPVPPGVMIQNPPPISFVQAFPTDQTYQVMNMPAGTVAYAPVATTLATAAVPHQQHYAPKQPPHQPAVYVSPQQPQNTTKKA